LGLRGGRRRSMSRSMETGDLGATNAERLLQLVRAVPAHSTLVDLGVVGDPTGLGTNGVSSEILLTDAEERGNTVIGVECQGACPARLAMRRPYRFARMDSVTWLSEQPETSMIALAFIDTLHNAEQVLCELYYLWPLVTVGGYIVCHDTAWPAAWGDWIAGRRWGHVEEGLDRFFRNAPARGVITREELSEFPGMTIVHKLREDDLRAGVDWSVPFGARRQFLGLQTWPWAVFDRDLPAGETLCTCSL
jgi:Methyltransferase domain